ncbi:hypothetical protein B5807_05633 [Epicoccum nigrum]|uniref:Uncharacterized protein n=1 Tax=Epicoccum nigrum TaxID=105696 RepID=A0A1Y2M0Q3_EPING|nr:hypothetical protein B5807_05633 [Epicoccum nigrum]
MASAVSLATTKSVYKRKGSLGFFLRIPNSLILKRLNPNLVIHATTTTTTTTTLNITRPQSARHIITAMYTSTPRSSSISSISSNASTAPPNATTTPHPSSSRRPSITIQSQQLPCTDREAQLYFLMGFKPTDAATGRSARSIGSLG